MLAIVAAGLLVAGTPYATAGQPATDEYVLQEPGVHQQEGGPTATADGRGSAEPQTGVVGEDEPAASQLDASISAATAAPLALAVVALMLLAAILIRRRARP